MVYIVKYAPIWLDKPSLHFNEMELPEDGFGKGFKEPPELNKIYDPKRPRYPGWWVHMYVATKNQVDEAFEKIQNYLLTTYQIETHRR